METIACLLVVALVFGGGVVFGMVMAEDSTTQGREDLEHKATVRAQMDALNRVQQLNTAFMSARGAMWEEAARHQTPEVR